VTQDPLLFVGIAALLTITPGADMAMVSRSVLIGGRREAFATTLGILAGCLVWAIVSAAGSTFLPQFVGPGDPALLLSILLAGVHIGFGLIWLTAYAWLLDRAVNAFKSSRVRRALDALTGTVLVALGLRLAAERR
jgi:threonine/homoserine/homoserine lactone efflux protein